MPKEHFLSAEFMLGRLLKLNLVNLGLEKNFREALENMGYDLDLLYEQESEQGLGMAGLGVTTVSLLEHRASKGKTAWGYGIRYDYGSFVQRFDADGR